MTAIEAAIAELEKQLAAVNRQLETLGNRQARAACRPRSIPSAGEAS